MRTVPLVVVGLVALASIGSLYAASNAPPLPGGVAAPVAFRAAAAGGTGAAALPTFALVSSGAHGSELNLGVTPNGHVFVGGWDTIARSADGGRTWGQLGLGVLPALPAVSANSAVAADRVLIADHDTGRVLVEDTDLACTILAFTDDEGATWTHNYEACGGGVTDHAKIAVGKRTTFADPSGLLYKNVIYACGNGLVEDDCGVSADGGATFLPTVPHGLNCAFQGVPKDFQGTLYEPSVACGPEIRKTSDNGLSWTELPLPFSASSDTPDLALTSDGTVYFFATDSSWHPVLLRSTDGGQHWAGPFAVPVPGLTSAVFPVIVGGDRGHVALAFYGTTDDSAGWDHNPGNAPDAIRWNGYEAVVTDADGAAPTVQPVQVTGTQPLQYGCLSKLGSCLDNIADYMGIDVSADGHPYAVFVDGCTGSCHDHASSTDDLGLVSIETSGPLLKA